MLWVQRDDNKHLMNEFERHIFMKQITDAVNKYPLRLFPVKGNFKPISMAGNVSKLTHLTAKPFKYGFSVAVFAPCTYLAAPGYRVPNHICPFYACLCHYIVLGKMKHFVIVFGDLGFKRQVLFLHLAYRIHQVFRAGKHHVLCIINGYLKL